MKAQLQNYVMTSAYCVSLPGFAPCITPAREFISVRKGRRPSIVKVEIKKGAIR